jgi:hypothetical protein
MNKQISELKLEDMQDVVGGVQAAMSVNPNSYSPYATIVAQPLYKQPAAASAPTWTVR